tara:strand:+ start:85593 stop:86036 length:444 start_codon:yes stop_codon:yes gene_type:complete
MITVFNSELNDGVIQSINELLEKDVSPKIAFNFMKITTNIQGIVDKKNEIYNKILQKYATPDPDTPNSFKVSEEFIQKFQSDMKELNDIKHEFNIDKIKIEDFNLEDNIKAKDLFNLKFIFDLDIPEVTTTGDDNFKKYDVSSEEVI